MSMKKKEKRVGYIDVLPNEIKQKLSGSINFGGANLETIGVLRQAKKELKLNTDMGFKNLKLYEVIIREVK